MTYERHKQCRRRRGLTWIELIVILFILVIVIALLIPFVTSTGHRSARVGCMSHLRQIGQAILLYSNDNRGEYPRTRTSATPVRVPTWGTGAAATQPFTDPIGPLDNDISAAIFLLLRTQNITADVFTCPATNAEADKFAGLNPAARSNFTDIKRNLSYSYQNPYPSDSTFNDSITNKLSGGPSSEFAIAADINPGTTGGNSANHDARGQNVLYGDGHVEWKKDRLAGVRRNDIYSTGDGTVIASPVDRGDSILLPTDD